MERSKKKSFNPSKLKHIKCRSLTLSPSNARNNTCIKGTLFYAAKRNQPLLIIVSSPSTERKQINEFAENIASLYYATFVLEILRTGETTKNILEKNRKKLDLVINHFRETKSNNNVNDYKKYLNCKKIGLVAFSEGAEICGAWSEANSKNSKVKAIFSISPVFAIKSRKLNHPVFIFAGNMDSLSELYSWDESNIFKMGAILRGGNHRRPIRRGKRQTGGQSNLRYTTLNTFDQFKIVYDSMALFFDAFFSKRKSNFDVFFSKRSPDMINIMWALQARYREDLRILYCNPKGSIIWGNAYKGFQNPKLYFKDCRQFKINSEQISSAEIRKNECEVISIPFTGVKICDRFLNSGVDYFFPPLAYGKYKSLVHRYTDALREEKVCIEKIEKIVEEIVKFLKNLYLEATDQHFPICKNDFPIMQCLINRIYSFVGDSENKNDYPWCQLRKHLKLKDFTAVDFLMDTISIVRRFKIQPWNHSAFAREIIWTNPNTKCTLCLDNFNVSKFSLLSLRMGQSYISRNLTQGNVLSESQKIDICVNGNSLDEIKVKFPFRRKVRISEPIKTINHNLAYYNDIEDIGLQCYLSYYLIPIVDIKNIHCIELHFQNPSGAIMLSEVAFTN